MLQINNQMSGKDFFHFNNGSNILRFITGYHGYLAHCVNRKVKVCQILNCPDCNNSILQVRRYRAGVINRANNCVEVLDFPSEVAYQIRRFERDKDWGSILRYDLNIRIEPQARIHDVINVMPKPKTSLSDIDLALKKETTLSDIFRLPKEFYLGWYPWSLELIKKFGLYHMENDYHIMHTMRAWDIDMDQNRELIGVSETLGSKLEVK